MEAYCAENQGTRVLVQALLLDSSKKIIVTVVIDVAAARGGLPWASQRTGYVPELSNSHCGPEPGCLEHPHFIHAREPRLREVL